MNRITGIKKLAAAVLLAFMLMPGISLSESLDQVKWHKLETKYTVIRYQSDKDLNEFSKKIRRVPHYLAEGFYNKPPVSTDLAEIVTYKVDSIYVRVQQILDMRKKMKKVNINIYSDRKQLEDIYFLLFKKKCLLKAWYLYRTNFIYIEPGNLTEGILAHEIAHSIIDHFLLVKPPSNTAEILARYVDSHLIPRKK